MTSFILKKDEPFIFNDFYLLAKTMVEPVPGY